MLSELANFRQKLADGWLAAILNFVNPGLLVAVASCKWANIYMQFCDTPQISMNVSVIMEDVTTSVQTLMVPLSVYAKFLTY